MKRGACWVKVIHMSTGSIVCSRLELVREAGWYVVLKVSRRILRDELVSRLLGRMGPGYASPLLDTSPCGFLWVL